MKYPRGFTLAEIMIVLAIVGVLTAILLPVAINSAPNENVMKFKKGNNENALKIHLHLYPLFRKLFMAPNPVPVKSALAELDIIKEYVRQPLVVLDDEEKKELTAIMDRYSF